MPNYKCTFIFNSNKVGWTEVYYRTAAGIDQLGGLTSLFAAARAPLLSNAALIEGIRISDEAIVGDAEVLFGKWEGSVGGKFNDNNDPDLPSVAWLCRASDVTRQHRRQVWLRGMADSILEYNPRGEPVPGADLVKKFQTFRGIVTDGWQMKVLSKNVADTKNILITALGRTADGFWLITAPAHTLATGDQVRIKGCRGTNVKTANGVFQVTVVDVNTFWIPVLAPAAGTFTYTGNGRMLKRVYVFVAIDSLKLERIGTKQTGRAFFVRPGRRRRVLR